MPALVIHHMFSRLHPGLPIHDSLKFPRKPFTVSLDCQLNMIIPSIISFPGQLHAPQVTHRMFWSLHPSLDCLFPTYGLLDVRESARNTGKLRNYAHSTRTTLYCAGQSVGEGKLRVLEVTWLPTEVTSIEFLYLIAYTLSLWWKLCVYQPQCAVCFFHWTRGSWS